MKPEVSIAMGLAVGALVGMIYQHAMPSLVDHRVGDPEDDTARKAERTAAVTSAAIVIGTALVAKDPTVFVIGGSVLIGFSLWHKHANLVQPLTGRATAPPAMDVDNNPMAGDMVYAD
jgi:hypothetical protein